MKRRQSWDSGSVGEGKRSETEGAAGTASMCADGSASPPNRPVQAPKPTPLVAAESGLQGRMPLVVKRAPGDTETSEGLPKRAKRGKGKAGARRTPLRFDDLLPELKLEILSYLMNDVVFVEQPNLDGNGDLVLSNDKNTFFDGPWCVSKAWNKLCRSKELWQRVPSFTPAGSINRNCFQFLGKKNQGTEGTCFKVMQRRSNRMYALKRARVYPTGEGVPYYMLRELAFLQGLHHPNVAAIERISLVKNRLYVFFDYMETSLFDMINPNNDASGGNPLPLWLIKRYLYQILSGVAFCHQRGVLHRNIKPKHLLLDFPALSKAGAARMVPVDEERQMLPSMLGVEEDAQSSATGKPNWMDRLGNPASSTGGGLVVEAKLISASSTNTVAAVAAAANAAVSHASRRPTIANLSGIRSGPGATTIATASASTDDKNTPHAVKVSPAVYDRMLQEAAHSTIKISDFALVRSSSIPLRSYTSEVVTLWYRSPEVLMGGKYFAAVDVWSIGCVFAEMLLGKPMFPGICEIDQLFQVFLKLGTPDNTIWPGFEQLPNFSFPFPNWKQRPLTAHIDGMDPDGLDLMTKMLTMNPAHRITAEDAMAHRFFDEVRGSQRKPSITGKSSLPTFDPSDEFAHPCHKPGCADMSKTAEVPMNDKVSDVLFSRPMVKAGSSKRWSPPQVCCWRYIRDIDTTFGPRTRSRTTTGLDDPVYLVRYYHHLKTLEASLYPLSGLDAHLDSSIPMVGTTTGNSRLFSAIGTMDHGEADQDDDEDDHQSDGSLPGEGDPFGLAAEVGTANQQHQEEEENNQHQQQQQQQQQPQQQEENLPGDVTNDADVGDRNRFESDAGNDFDASWFEREAVNLPAPVRLPGGGQSETEERDTELFAGIPEELLVPLDRSLLVEWLVEVIDVFEMSIRSVFLAMTFADRMLALHGMSDQGFQLLGATCLHIASKCEDVSYIGVEDLVVCADRIYRAEDVLRLEERVLTTLNFHICSPTVIDFVNVFAVRMRFGEAEDAMSTVGGDASSLGRQDVSPTAQLIAQYIAELSLEDRFFVRCFPSEVAASALVLGIYTTNTPVIDARFRAVTAYTIKELEPCIRRLNSNYVDVRFRANPNVIQRRYLRPINGRVAEVEGRRDLGPLFASCAAQTSPDSPETTMVGNAPGSADDAGDLPSSSSSNPPTPSRSSRRRRAARTPTRTRGSATPARPTRSSTRIRRQRQRQRQRQP
ncbi:Cyclin-dependent kinase 2 (Cell division protein kinase 2) [Durusdinium trenchii]|uniref:Cyclin-dependent kinase 2 homolog n=1 Tax=Durusdinium trenchii TaxID=1381693 RepID=A0ABP0KI01_9DINO